MSFGISSENFIAVGTLALQLRREYASAPEEGRQLSADLAVFHACIATIEQDIADPGSPIHQYSESQALHFRTIWQNIDSVLRHLQQVSNNRRSLLGPQPRTWDRLNFPTTQVRAIRARLQLQTAALTLFLTSLNATTFASSLARIEEVLAEVVRSRQTQSLLQGRNENNEEDNWSQLLSNFEQQGIERQAAELYRGPIEDYFRALSEVEIAETELEIELETTVGPSDAVSNTRDETITSLAYGPPTQEHFRSGLCPGAVLLHESGARSSPIRQYRSIIFKYIGGTKYKLVCRKCNFTGFQDEPLNDLAKPTNTPLLFCELEKRPTSLEAYCEIYGQHSGQREVIYYRTQFFWKCHRPATRQLKHNEAEYECIFCPITVAAGSVYTRGTLLEHIRRIHTQTPLTEAQRKQFNVWIDVEPALFEQDMGRIKGRNFDILLPRAFGATEMRRAEHAQRQYERRSSPFTSSLPIQPTNPASPTRHTHSADLNSRSSRTSRNSRSQV